MSIVNVKKKILNKRDIKDFETWNKLPNTLYIGRNMSFYVKGATKSKWANPFSVKKHGRDRCLVLYEKYLKNTPELFNNLSKLQGKELGCWCHPKPCHGDILIKLLN
jgi:hypothetical protein